MGMPFSKIKDRNVKFALLLGAATMLQGCVAAIPLAAGGLLTGSNVVSNDRRPVAATPATAAAIPAAAEGTVTVGAREAKPLSSTVPTPASNLAVPGPSVPVSADEGPSASIATETGAAVIVAVPEPETKLVVPNPVSVSSDAGFADAYREGSRDEGASSALSSAQAAAALASTRAAPTAAPTVSDATSTPARAVSAPAIVEPPVSATTRTVAPQIDRPAPNAVTQLLSYANQRQFTSGDNRMSAMLADRISLEPKRAQCGGIRPAVLIDLDPKGGVFAPGQATNPPAGLGAGLSQLRAQGVHIAWISSNPETLSNQIRRALTRTGLDIYGRDTVLLVSKDDDRKQTLREEFAKINCVIAIAGDTRSDFDELYDYLLDPSEASSLEPLFSEGWFLIPQPLVSEGS